MEASVQESALPPDVVPSRCSGRTRVTCTVQQKSLPRLGSKRPPPPRWLLCLSLLPSLSIWYHSLLGKLCHEDPVERLPGEDLKLLLTATWLSLEDPVPALVKSPETAALPRTTLHADPESCGARATRLRSLHSQLPDPLPCKQMIYVCCSPLLGLRLCFT